VPVWYFSPVIIGWLSAAVNFVLNPTFLNATVCGMTMAWIGLAIQHTGNHGGLTQDPVWGYLLGLLNDIAPGGSSLVWRFHHHVSHHMYTNDDTLDQDTYTSYTFMRLDPKSQPWKWYHQYQHLYMPVMTMFLYWSIQMQDLICLFTWRTENVHFTGADRREFLVAILTKMLHFIWFWAAPYHLHGTASLLPCFWAGCCGSLFLSLVFLVSHNTPIIERPTAFTKMDWAEYQIRTSCSWGGAIGAFWTGGLNLQIEHHLFPCMAHNLYPEAQKIVREECAKRNIPYYYYPSFLSNLKGCLDYLHLLGHTKGDKVE
jgi:fatty acid desaturase (delta-4 desaturase)